MSSAGKSIPTINWTLPPRTLVAALQMHEASASKFSMSVGWEPKYAQLTSPMEGSIWHLPDSRLGREGDLQSAAMLCAPADSDGTYTLQWNATHQGSNPKCSPDLNVADGLQEHPEHQSGHDDENQFQDTLGRYAQNITKRDYASANCYQDMTREVQEDSCGRNPWKSALRLNDVSVDRSAETNDTVLSPHITGDWLFQRNDIQVLYTPKPVQPCHDIGTYQRELKPENIFVFDEDLVLQEESLKLADLGPLSPSSLLPQSRAISDKQKSHRPEHPAIFHEQHPDFFVPEAFGQNGSPSMRNVIPEPTTGPSTGLYSTCHRGRSKASHSSLPSCKKCGLTFSRATDLDRHLGIHLPERRKYRCHFSGCEYRGSYRKDKLASHVKNRHSREMRIGV